MVVNGKPALRVGDPGVHAACCGPNTWTASTGAPGVFINGLKAHRKTDADDHCGGTGKMIEGSADVIVGNYAAASGPAPEHSTVLIDPEQRHKFAAVLKAPDGRVVANVPVTVTLPDGSERKMRSDYKGRVQVFGVEPGSCTVRIDPAWFEYKGETGG